jgi:hypothetical protein
MLTSDNMRKVDSAARGPGDLICTNSPGLGAATATSFACLGRFTDSRSRSLDAQERDGGETQRE